MKKVTIYWLFSFLMFFSCSQEKQSPEKKFMDMDANPEGEYVMLHDKTAKKAIQLEEPFQTSKDSLAHLTLMDIGTDSNKSVVKFQTKQSDEPMKFPAEPKPQE